MSEYSLLKKLFNVKSNEKTKLIEKMMSMSFKDFDKMQWKQMEEIQNKCKNDIEQANTIPRDIELALLIKVYFILMEELMRRIQEKEKNFSLEEILSRKSDIGKQQDWLSSESYKTRNEYAYLEIANMLDTQILRIHWFEKGNDSINEMQNILKQYQQNRNGIEQQSLCFEPEDLKPKNNEIFLKFCELMKESSKVL